MVIAPSGSAARSMPSARLSSTNRRITASTAIPTGTLTKKIHSHPRYSVSRPPASTPTAAPEPPTAPQMPSALLRSAPSVKVVDTIDRPAGVTSAAPRPCTARAAISAVSLLARPQANDAIVKRITPATNILRRPSRSAARPPSSRKPPNVIA